MPDPNPCYKEFHRIINVYLCKNFVLKMDDHHREILINFQG
jgi:hypothetical protein